MLGRCGALNKGRASALASSLRASRHFACGSAWHMLGALYRSATPRRAHGFVHMSHDTVFHCTTAAYSIRLEFPRVRFADRRTQSLNTDES